MAKRLTAIPGESSQYACIDLVNSSFAHYLESGQEAYDRLPDPDWQAWFMARHDLVLKQGTVFPVAKMRSRRTQLRATLADWAQDGSVSSPRVAHLDRDVKRAASRYRVTEARDGAIDLHLEPVSRDEDWLVASVALSAVMLISTEQPERLKVCGNPSCSWMFFDDTLNRSRIYCSDQPCGTLMRVRRFRASRRSTAR